MIVPIIFTAKASMTAMIGIFFVILIFQNRKKINIKDLTIFVIISSIIFSVLYFENLNIINRSFFERDDLKQIYNQTEYNNVADPNIFITLILMTLLGTLRATIMQTQLLALL